jgi:hypothetical protein
LKSIKQKFTNIKSYENAAIARILEVHYTENLEVDVKFINRMSEFFEFGKQIDSLCFKFNKKSDDIIKESMISLRKYVRNKKLDQIIEQ